MSLVVSTKSLYLLHLHCCSKDSLRTENLFISFYFQQVHLMSELFFNELTVAALLTITKKGWLRKTFVSSDEKSYSKLDSSEVRSCLQVV